MDDGALLNVMMQAEATAARAGKQPVPPLPQTTARTPFDRAWRSLATRMNARAAQMDEEVRRGAQSWQNRIFNGVGIEPHDAGTGE
jgi:uncharacterized lipoprotein